jgi:dTDP-4-dehydrorhamnose 3,5-epimerase
VIDGVRVIPLTRHEDDRGWFSEIARAAWLPEPAVQTNVVFSRQGVIRGLHYHERGQCDLFVCLSGMVRVVVLDRSSNEVFSVDIGDDNPAGVWVPGHHGHGYEALTDALVCYHVTREFNRDDPDELGLAWDDPRVQHVWETTRPTLSTRDSGAADTSRR